MPNWCQKFNIDPVVVTARYEAVRGFVPGLSPRGRSSAKKKLLAALYSGIVLALVFLSVWAQQTGRWSPILKIAGLILIVGIIYVVVFQHHRFTPHQSRLWRDQKQLSQVYGEQSRAIQEQLIASQEETARLKEQLSSAQNELDKTKAQLDSNQQQLIQEQEQRKNSEDKARQLETQVSELNGQIDSKDKLLRQKDYASNESTDPYGRQVGIEQIMDWGKQGMPTQEIIKRIKTSHSTYGLQAEDISYLKEHGVSQEVIQAMSASP